MHRRSDSLRLRIRRAFTLLEVVIAIALAGILLTASAGVVMNTVNLWDKSENIASLDRHLAGLDRFLSALIETQKTTQVAQSSTGKKIVGCTWTQPPDKDESFPQFTLTEAYPILQLEEKPAPKITVWLYWDNDGLWLISQSPRQRNDNESNVSFTLLSPLLDSVRILVWEEEAGTWEAVDTVESETLQSRALRLALRFNENGKTRERVFTLSKVLAGGITY